MQTSVIIPTKNRLAYLEQAIKSVFRVRELHGLELEVIVVDDGSTDGTPEAMARLPVRFFTNAGKGASAARNTGIRASRAEYIAFLDDDDVWLDGHLGEHVRVLNEHPNVGLVFSRGYLTDSNLENKDGPYPRLPLPRGDAFRWHLANDVPTCNLLVRRALLDEVGLYDERLPSAEDCDLGMRLAARSDFYGLEPATVLWRQHPRKSPSFADWQRRSDAVWPMFSRNYRMPARVEVSRFDRMRAELQRRGWHAANTIVNARQCLAEGRTTEAAKFFLGAARTSPLHCVKMRNFWTTGLDVATKLVRR
jgi:glycosyltransferase involved in cell wall biosynthesis